MMENTNKRIPTQQIVVLISVIALTLAGWLAGHILRFSISGFLHPPIEQITPQIQNGFQPEGIRREVVLMGTGIFTSDGSVLPNVFAVEICMGNIYYTSLPAKCRSADGRLVKVEGTDRVRVFIPPEK